jgi:hypothetical protein
MQIQTSKNQRDAPGQDTGRAQGHLSSYVLGPCCMWWDVTQTCSATCLPQHCNTIISTLLPTVVYLDKLIKVSQFSTPDSLNHHVQREYEPSRAFCRSV